MRESVRHQVASDLHRGVVLARESGDADNIRLFEALSQHLFLHFLTIDEVVARSLDNEAMSAHKRQFLNLDASGYKFILSALTMCVATIQLGVRDRAAQDADHKVGALEWYNKTAMGICLIYDRLPSFREKWAHTLTALPDAPTLATDCYIQVLEEFRPILGLQNANTPLDMLTFTALAIRCMNAIEAAENAF
jgi:hypothetical protein